MTSLPLSFLTAPIAHRGFYDMAAGQPENSRAAFVAAIRAGYGIEMDVQLSADGTAMVFHDYDLGRLTDAKGAVRQRSSAELGRIPLKGSDETIPTLREVLALVDGRAPLLIEAKDQDGAMGENVGTLEVALAEALTSYRGPVAVMSFNPHTVARFGDLAPRIPRGLATGAFASEIWRLLPEKTRARLRNIPDFTDVGACFISHQASDLNNPRVAELKENGTPILCWTIRNPAEEAHARQIADNITFEGYAPPLPSAG